MILADVRVRALRALRPSPKLRLSEWLETHVRLPEGTTALPGPLRLWPYQREMADAIGDPSIERVTLVKPVRVGFTTLLTGAVASSVANDPAPILCLLSTESDARDYVVSEVEPLFAATPAVAGALSADTGEGARNTLAHRRFPGGSLKVVAAKAPRNLRRHTARVLLVDECDAMEVGAEGSPILLAERRTLSFPDRKIVLGSTPLDEETSHVLRALTHSGAGTVSGSAMLRNLLTRTAALEASTANDEARTVDCVWSTGAPVDAASDQRVFEVPCTRCGAFTEILWSHIEWEPMSTRLPVLVSSVGKSVKDKHAIRCAFHPQLADLWGQPPLNIFRDRATRLPEENTSGVDIAFPCLITDVGRFAFAPLVSSRLNLVAALRVDFLRPGPPGAPVSGGDIDNRMKTLLDALRVPKNETELPKEAVPDAADRRVFCLLEDDALVTALSVTTDRLLAPQRPDEVVLVIHVEVKATELSWQNIGITA